MGWRDTLREEAPPTEEQKPSSWRDRVRTEELQAPFAQRHPVLSQVRSALGTDTDAEYFPAPAPQSKGPVNMTVAGNPALMSAATSALAAGPLAGVLNKTGVTGLISKAPGAIKGFVKEASKDALPIGSGIAFDAITGNDKGSGLQSGFGAALLRRIISKRLGGL